MKKRYGVGFYDIKKRKEDAEWMKIGQNRLIAFIFDNEEMFDIKYKSYDESRDRAWVVLDVKELEKAKECFKNEDTTEVVEWIDKCLDYDIWQTACICCDSISINTIPYTYREYGGTIGREYNCPVCSGLTNRHAHTVRKEYNEHGVDAAINLMIDMYEGNYEDKESKYYCPCCEIDLRQGALVKDSKELYVPFTLDLENKADKYECISIKDYEEMELKIMEETGGQYIPDTYQFDSIEGYSCFYCGTKADDSVVKEVTSNVVNS